MLLLFQFIFFIACLFSVSVISTYNFIVSLFLLILSLILSSYSKFSSCKLDYWSEIFIIL